MGQKRWPVVAREEGKEGVKTDGQLCFIGGCIALLQGFIPPFPTNNWEEDNSASLPFLWVGTLSMRATP